MKVECKDREEILREQEPQAMESLRLHARECAACREEFRLWEEISAAAPLLHKDWESPELWPRIHQALAEESQRAPERRVPSGWPKWLPEWRVALATVVLLAVSAAGAALLFRGLPSPDTGGRVVEDQEQQRLLTDQALRETELREAEYIRSIENLARLAEPRVQQAETPLMMNYREKLMVLDAAIAECRTQLDENRFNAHLRREMLSLYQDKQHTLEAVLREE